MTSGELFDELRPEDGADRDVLVLKLGAVPGWPGPGTAAPEAVVVDATGEPVTAQAVDAVLHAAAACAQAAVPLALTVTESRARRLLEAQADDLDRPFTVHATLTAARASVHPAGPAADGPSEESAASRAALLEQLDPTHLRSLPPAQAKAVSRQLFALLAESEPGTRVYSRARAALIDSNMALVGFALRDVRRAADGQEEDLRQVAVIGLIRAVDRFDPSYGYAFATFALPTIRGELRRYLRDHTWAVHVPRTLQERYLLVMRTRTHLHDTLGREPSTHELAAPLDLTPHQVDEAMSVRAARAPHSLDLPDDPDRPGFDHEAPFAVWDADLERAADLVALRTSIAALGERDRTLLALRFTHGLTQAQTGDCLGIGQVQVSRTERRILDRLRRALDN